MKREVYPAARIVAPQIQDHFARHLADAARRGQHPLAIIPDTSTIEAIIDTAFWASLRREETYAPKISLAFVAPQHSGRPLTLARPLPLTPDALTRVAPAVERPGIHLGVWRQDDELSVWGTTRTIPTICFVLEVAAPGLLVIKHQSAEESGKYVNVAVLEGDQIKVVDERASNMPECPALLTSLLGFDSATSWAHSVNVLVHLAVSMRAHAHGGSLLIVPAGTDAWRESIVQPMPYAASPAFDELATLNPANEDAAFRHAIDSIAGLTAVDGAVVLTHQYELLGFGAKIARRKGSPQVDLVTVTEPIEGSTPALVHPEQLGGTRHLSAAQFVHDQHDAAALVASQDGRFTMFEWSPCEAMVHAHRVEALLL